ncbi:MAG: hypothetical protein AAF679_05580 [Pseudomonadota bacterium]
MDEVKGCVILADMRTGSNQLESNLAQFPGLQTYGEVFNPSFMGRDGQEELLGCSMASRATTAEAVLEAMVAAQGLPVFRLFPDHDLRVEQLVLEDPRWAKVFLRRSPLESFLSREAARQTGQWRLRREFQRQTQKVMFDADRFEAYAAKQAATYAGWEHALRRSGQSYFPLSYPECGDLDLLNGLVGWLGLPDRLEALEEATVRQNPAALVDRVENLEELEAFLARAGYIPHIPAAPTQELLLHLPCDAVGAWAPHGGPPSSQTVGGCLRTGSLSQLPVFGVVDPLVRAQAIFEARLLRDGPDLFPYIRTTLRNEYGVALPEQPLDKGGQLPEADYIRAFEQFLTFLESNLKGLTSIRQDPAWLSQATYARALGAVVPLKAIASQHRQWAAPDALEHPGLHSKIAQIYGDDLQLWSHCGSG